jgi:flagella basal body P-ring formation protein FlgA
MLGAAALGKRAISRLRAAAFAGAALLAAPIAASADETIVQAVQRFLHAQAGDQGEEIVIEVHPPSAALPDCASPTPFLPRPLQSVGGRVSVGVRCGDDGRQVRYLQADIDVYGNYPVLAQPVSAGTLVTAEMLKSQRGNLSQLPRDAVREPEAVVGQIARRSVAAGVPLQHRQFEKKPLVERGQRVVVEARGASFRVTREGTALDPGAAGDLVRVQFPDRELVHARVVGDGRLVIDY